jgi:hypothetical protein
MHTPVCVWLCVRALPFAILLVGVHSQDAQGLRQAPAHTLGKDPYLRFAISADVCASRTHTHTRTETHTHTHFVRLQVGVQSQYAHGTGQVILYLGNKHAEAQVQALAIRATPPAGLQVFWVWVAG